VPSCVSRSRSGRALAGCGVLDPKQVRASAAPALAPAEVAVLTLHPERVALKTELVGRKAPFRSAEVRPQVTGIVKARLFREGANVQVSKETSAARSRAVQFDRG
jgi:membrane fusion protein (multidrug efflux system)